MLYQLSYNHHSRRGCYLAKAISNEGSPNLPLLVLSRQRLNRVYTHSTTIVRGGACKNPLAIVPQFSSSLHAGNVRATWQGIEPCGTGNLLVTASQPIEKLSCESYSVRFEFQTGNWTIQSHHVTPYVLKTGRRLTACLTALKETYCLTNCVPVFVYL